MKYGSEFKKIRLARGKTQKEIAEKIGKSVMLISGVETGKNKTFSDNDFIILANYLNFTEKEKNRLYKLATASNKKLPKELTDFICSADKMIDLLEILNDKKCSEIELDLIIEYCKKTFKENERC